MGVSTDAAGNFVLDMPDGIRFSQFSFIGMETQEVKLGGTEIQSECGVDMAVDSPLNRYCFHGVHGDDSKKEPRVPWPW